jgi:hypothetical protein
LVEHDPVSTTLPPELPKLDVPDTEQPEGGSSGASVVNTVTVLEIG